MTPVKSGVQETSKQIGSFFQIMKEQPLSLALVVMNFLLMGFLFYSGTARKDTVDMIVKWQADTDKLMASCVSGEVVKVVLDAMQNVIETDRRLRTVIDKIKPVEP